MTYALLALMFLAAIVLSMLGQGGGSLYTPIQTWLGVGFHEAATTSLFLIVATSISSSLVYGKAKKIDLPLVAVLESVTMTGSFIGGVASERISAEALGLLFAATLAVAAYFMIRLPQTRAPWKPARGLLAWHRNVGDQRYQVSMVVALPLSLLAGSFSGLLGVGGGIVKVPMLVLILGVPVDIAIGSSALMVGMTAASGFVGHVVVGHWDWQRSLLLAVVVLIGAQFGSRLSVGLDSERLRRYFGWFLLAVALLMTLSSVA